MTIRVKIILIVLPLIITPLILTGVASSLAARTGITGVTTEFLRFKAEELQKYAENQWTLLVENGLSKQEEYVSVAKSATESFARSLIRSETELIFAVNLEGSLEMSSRELSLKAADTAALSKIVNSEQSGWQSFTLNGTRRVAHIFPFEPFSWIIFVSQQEKVFYRAVNQIYVQGSLILSVSLLAAVFLLVFFAAHLTRPLRQVVGAMKDIMVNNDLSKKVEILYQDETGDLGHAFNLMTSELEKAYDQIKIYALETAISQKNEQKIRNIFQRYVPKDVVDKFYHAPDSLLVGENKVLAILFSDIRQFTAISEGLQPEELVESLNK